MEKQIGLNFYME